MNFKKFNRLLASSTYRELGLRAKEYLQYLNWTLGKLMWVKFAF